MGPGPSWPMGRGPWTRDPNLDEFNKMKDGVRIVNAGRGGVINEDALLEAINSGKVTLDFVGFSSVSNRCPMPEL